MEAVEAAAEAAVPSARRHEQPRELLRLLIAAELVAEPLVQSDGLIGRDDRIGPALEDEKLAAARLELAEIAGRGAVQNRPELGVDLGHVAIEIELAPVPVAAQSPFKEAIERRLARRIGGRFQERPVEGSELAARRPAIIDGLASVVLRTGIEGFRGRDLAGSQAIGRIAGLTRQRCGIEIASRGIGDERIRLEPVALGVAGGDGRFVEERELRVRELVPWLEIGGDIVPRDGGVPPGAAHDRGADKNAVVVVGIIFRFDEPLLAAGRAAGVIGMFRRFAIESLGDILADDRHHMGRKASPVLPFLRMADERIAVQRIRRRRSHVGVGGGVAAFDRRLHAGIAEIEYAAVTAVAVAMEDAGPSLFRQPHLDADVGVRRALDGGGHAAERRHALAGDLVGRRIVAGRNRFRRLDRGVGKLEARQVLARGGKSRRRADKRRKGDGGAQRPLRQKTNPPRAFLRHIPLHFGHFGSARGVDPFGDSVERNARKVNVGVLEKPLTGEVAIGARITAP